MFVAHAKIDIKSIVSNREAGVSFESVYTGSASEKFAVAFFVILMKPQGAPGNALIVTLAQFNELSDEP